MLSRILTASVLCLLISSCASTGPTSAGGGANLRRDEMGHRPGPRGFSTVILDAGHGGKDPGAVSRSTGNREKDLALDTARRVRAKLRGKVNVVMMRDQDRFIDLDDRVDSASRRDSSILVSIHYNSGPAHLRGPETYWWRVDSWGLATRVQRNLVRAAPGGVGNRGQVRRRLRLTRNPSVPCILVECGYLSNPSEAARCADPAYRDRLASAIAAAILNQHREGDPAGTLPRAIDSPPSRPTDAADS